MKFGILGGGSIGARHYANLLQLGHETLLYDPVAHQDFGCASREEVFAWADAMVIATPTTRHYDDLMDCMDAGKPTFVEKPIAANQQEWEEISRLRELPQIFVGYNLRFHPLVRAAKNRLDGKTIGQPLYASFILAQISLKPDYLRDGVVLNWSHEIDLARYLLGPCEVVFSVIRKDPIEDEADIHMVHHGFIRSDVHLNYISEPQCRKFTIVGTKGAFTVDLTTNPEAFAQSYRDEMRAFLDHIAGKPTSGATGDDGCAVLQLCLDARRTAGL